VTAAEPSLQGGLLEKLLASVRPEFRVDVFVPAVGDLIFAGPPCVVAGCHRFRGHVASGLCHPHRQRWRRDYAHLDLATFVATTSPDMPGSRQLTPCRVAGCRRCHSAHGLCMAHWKAWRKAGSPDPTAWAATVTVDPASTRPSCEFPDCELWIEFSHTPFCRLHLLRWQGFQRRTGRQDLAEFFDYCQLRALERCDLRPLSPQLKLEFQHALQCRADQRRAGVRLRDITILVGFVTDSGVGSLLDWPETRWMASFGERYRTNTNARGFLRYAHQRLQDLVVGRGWEAEYPRDVWDLRRLGIQGRARWLRFDRIPQPWLRALLKRWARWKLSTGATASHVHQHLTALTRFAELLAGPTVQVSCLAEVSREVLERYLAQVASQPRAARTRSTYVSAVNGFLVAIRQHRWDATLAGDAAIYSEDFPKTADLPPRALPEFVMAQIERPANLARLADPAIRLTTLILIQTGLRLGDGTGLEFDCVVHDGQGAPYLRYWNHKLRREGLVPIDDELLEAIRRQQQQVRERFPQPTVLLPRPKANPDGRWPLSQTAYRRQLHQWLATCNVRDVTGRPVHVTPHQFRHTLGTRLINNDVPLEVVRVILDHESLAMSGHYARLKDETVRKHWERARKVNCQGEEVVLEPSSPLADAQWVKHRVGLAKQALPNGYCGLPLIKTCPHANACLTCPVFVTTPEFLDQHRAHREQTRQLLETATANSQLRMVEMNQQVLGNLDRIITKLEAGEDPQASLDVPLEEAADAG
jgi:integrase